MIKTTFGQILVNEALPEDLRDYNRKLDKKGTSALFREIAEKYPERYKEIAKKLYDIGRRSATESGGYSFGLDALKTPEKTKKLKESLQRQVEAIQTSNLDDAEKQKRIVDLLRSKAKEIETHLYEEASAMKNPLALQVMSGARGNPGNLRSVLFGDLLYEDHRGHPIPIPVLRSYSQGLSPVEYWSGTFGTRKGIADLKFATQDAGFFCLAKGTLVRRPDGTSAAIETLKAGDVVLGADKNGVAFPVTVTKLFDNGPRDVWRYVFRAGKSRTGFVSIEATEQHRVLAKMKRGRPGTPHGDKNSITEPTKLPLSRASTGFCMVPVQGVLVGKDDGDDWTSIHRFSKHIRLPGRKQEILNTYVKLMTEPVRASEFLYSYVRKEFLGVRQTYDIEVDHPDHLFVLDNGMIVSNSKQLNQATHRLVVQALDADKPDDNIRGVPMPTDDPDNEGALLAQDIGGYRRNQILTPKVLADLKARGHDRILIRSPMVGGPPDGGLYAADVGVRERGGLPAPGDNVGMAAAQALTEPVTQAQISSKHTGGVAGAGSAISGFKYINQLVQVPKTFTGGASHAQTDGKVGAIYDAPAGGKYVMIGGVRHFISAGFEPKVKPGDIVEAGDVISDGLPNPAEIVRHKGIGEGRRYFVDIMRKVYKDSGMKAHRRNIELLARGLINHIQLTDEMGDYVPGDIVPYDMLEHHWQPREGYAIVPAKAAVGKYLERPVLHYSIGTKVRPSMLKEFDHFGVKHVIIHPEPPPFEPVMIRAMDNLLHDPDWMTRQLGTNLRKSLLLGAHRGATSDELGTSFVPALARAKDFGRIGKTKGWRPEQVVKTELLHPETEQFAE